MRKLHISTLLSFAVLSIGLLGLALPGGMRKAHAEGANLDGRMAPDMTFARAVNLPDGTSLSSLRGKVVWIKFWLRDCPICRKALPEAQTWHEQYAGRGLVVLTVLHQFPPEQVRAYLEREGFTFPVGIDADGSLAQRYGVRHRPTDYVIGIDGRVKASNPGGAPRSVLLAELARYRLARVDPIPDGLDEVRKAVWAWDYRSALTRVEAAAQAEGAPEAVREAARRVRALATEELEAILRIAATHERKRDVEGARKVHEKVLEIFAGTSLEEQARAAREAFRARTGR